MRGAVWVTKDLLARSSRPGYPSRDVDPAVVHEWVSGIKGIGVRSIVCLLSDEQLAFYLEVPGGLLNYYRQNGFLVTHIPITDPASDPSGWDELNSKLDVAYRNFLELPKPVLIHCSAGVDRTGKVITHIVSQNKL
jgi:hypothetical protein